MLNEEVLRLLREDPAFREEVRRQILTDELVTLPEKVERLRADMNEQFEKVWKAIGSLTERIDALTGRFDALAEVQQRTEARLEALTARIEALAEAQQRTEARLEALTARIDALAEAQQRTEARLEALTARVDALAERMAALTARVDDLTEQMAALTARVDALTEQMTALTARVDALTEQMAALTARVDALTEAQLRTEARLEDLTARVDGAIRTIGRLEERWGLAHEQIAQDLVPEILRRKGWKVLKAAPLTFNREMDVVVAVEAKGRVFTLATEVKGRVWSRTPMDQVLAKIRQPAFVAAARREGFPEPIVPAIFGLVVYTGADEVARQAGVGLYSPYGELVAPALEG